MNFMEKILYIGFKFPEIRSLCNDPSNCSDPADFEMKDGSR